MQLVIFSRQQWCVRKTKFSNYFYKTQTLISLFHAKNKTTQNRNALLALTSKKALHFFTSTKEEQPFADKRFSFSAFKATIPLP